MRRLPFHELDGGETEDANAEKEHGAGFGVAVPGVAWLKPMLSMKKSHSGSAIVMVMTLPTVGNPTVTSPKLS